MNSEETLLTDHFGAEPRFVSRPLRPSPLPLKAQNTGHCGGLATIHVNSAYEGLTRLEDLIGEDAADLYRALTQAINILIYIDRNTSGRVIRDVSRLIGRSNDVYFRVEKRECRAVAGM